MTATVGGGIKIILDLTPPDIGFIIKIPPLLTISGGIHLSSGLLSAFPAQSLPASIAGGSSQPALPFVAPSGGLLPNLVGSIGGLLDSRPASGGTSTIDLGGTHITLPVFKNS